MSDWLRQHGGESDGVGRDMELANAFRSLDPATYDPNYWFRFRGWVMTGAARELARRRLMAQLTVGEVMSSWARALVPTAVLAAAVAGMLLVRSGEATAPPMALEEFLVSEIPGERLPLLLAPESNEAAVVFAVTDVY